jgi:hypothetical protein
LEGKKQGRLQHRLQLGIPLPCEAGRIVDQVPILGKWSHRLKSTETFKEKDRKVGGGGGESSFCTLEKIFRTQILFPNIAEVTFTTFPFSLLTLGML